VNTPKPANVVNNSVRRRVARRRPGLHPGGPGRARVRSGSFDATRPDGTRFTASPHAARKITRRAADGKITRLIAGKRIDKVKRVAQRAFVAARRRAS
jgi:hypothetical protein